MPVWLRSISSPLQQLVDAGYVTIETLVQSQAGSKVDLVGPTLKTHWYQAETGYDLTHFSIDWEAEQVTCPQGRISSSWTPVQDAGKSLIKVKFSRRDCQPCPSRTLCTGTTRRSLTLHPREQMQALFAARQRESTDAFKATYRHRAGIEGTHSEAGTHHGLTSLTLYWYAQNPSGPCGYCDRYQWYSIDELAARRNAGTDSHLALQTGDEAGGLR